MNSILVLGAGKSATVLIDQLAQKSAHDNLRVMVADLSVAHLSHYDSANFHSIVLDIHHQESVQKLIQETDIVVSLLPPQFHSLVAQYCLAYSKHFITASYQDSYIKNIHKEVKEKSLFFISEMGLDPGIDHLLAMEMIEEIRSLENAKFLSFESYCGGLVAPESNNNPFQYKITWNPYNVASAGKAGAIFLENSKKVELDYNQVFTASKTLQISTAGAFDMYANRDSLSYIDSYGLQGIHTFIRGTLRYPGFCKLWFKLIESGLTSDFIIENNDALQIRLQNCNDSDINWLFADTKIIQPTKALDLLCETLQNKLIFMPNDKDRVVLYHKIEFEHEGKKHSKDYLLDKIGQNKQFTAMSETVSMPIFACIELILEKKFKNHGLILPFDIQSFKPILSKLRSYKTLL
ncbi:MAG: saccharopine dehydrogenase C-terminal domain-containing protein [Cytophagales bacterium]